MKQNKNTFVFDNFVEMVGEEGLRKITNYLNLAEVTFCVEPWGDSMCRVYVRKDVKHILDGAWQATISHKDDSES